MGSVALPPLPPHPLVAARIIDLVGNTPLVRIDLESDSPRAAVYAKAEHLNPGGSLKDRIALAIVEAAERDGSLRPGGVVVEATSGNTGIGLALVCASKGYRCTLTMPASMSLERRQLLAAYGVEVVLTEPERQLEGAIEKAHEIVAATPGAFLVRQFENPENPRVHETVTATEIVAALGGESARIDAFVAGVGTGGSVTGVGRALKRARPRVRVVAVEPSSSPTLSTGERGPTKIQGLAAGFVPKNFDRSIVDEIRTVTDRDAYDTTRALARKAGLLVGISSGAAMRAALDVAREIGPEGTVVTILADTGERYFSLDEYFDP